MGGEPSGTAELFLLCARTARSGGDRERILAIVRNGPDWDLLLSLAERNEVLGIVHSSLSEVCPELLPDAIRNRLRLAALSYATDGLQLTAKLAEVVQALEAEGIEAVVLKGPPLAASLYDCVLLRRFGDLDILIHLDDLPRARGLLLRNGFDWDGKGSTCEPGTLSQTDKHLSLAHQTQGIALELHWSCEEPADRFMLRMEDIFRSAVRITLPGGTSARCPGPEEQLLLLSAHGARHGWKHLKWVCDIDRLIRKRTEIEIYAVLDRARQLGCRKRVLLALAAAADLLKAPLPAPVQQEIDVTRSLKELMAEIRGAITLPPHDAQTETLDLAEERRLHFAINCRERFSDRLLLAFGRYSSSFCPNVRDFEFVKLPSAFRWLYWLVRPVRLIHRYGVRCFTEPTRWVAQSIWG